MYNNITSKIVTTILCATSMSACMPSHETHKPMKAVSSANILELTSAGEKVTLYPSAKLKSFNGCSHIITLSQVSNLNRDAALIELKNTVGLFGANSGTVNSYSETDQGTQYIISAFDCTQAPK